MDTERDVLSLLDHVADGTIPPEDTLLRLKLSPFEGLGYARVNHRRSPRQGVSETIYGQSETPGQTTRILEALRSHGYKNVFATRIAQETADLIAKDTETTCEPLAKPATVFPEKIGRHGFIMAATGGTSDTGIAEKATLTVKTPENSVTRVYDMGVAELRRPFSNLKPLMIARVVIAVVGIKGALTSMIGGPVDRLVIAVPTSIGYGANFGGVAALLSMLNSCASGVSVVNIDNGFGVGYLASQTNHTGEPTHRSMPQTSEITWLYISECVTKRIVITPAGVPAALLFTRKNLFERLAFQTLEWTWY